MNNQKTFLFLTILATIVYVSSTETTQKQDPKKVAKQLLDQLPKPTNVNSCPAKWIQRLLQPCSCNEDAPNQLLCTGEVLVNEALEKMNYRINLMKKIYATLHQVQKVKQLQDGLAQFDTVVIANTGLTRLNTAVFKHFGPVRNVLLDSDRLLREVHLVDTFGRRTDLGQEIVELDNFFLVNMNDLSIDE